jgi:monoamine oxidase
MLYPMTEQTADVVVIGAGVAGLAAARVLDAAGLRVLIIEARERIGGRLYTLRQSGTPLPIEMGAEFVHGTPAETWQIIRAANLAVCDVPDTHWNLHEGQLSQDEAFWEEIQSVFGRLDQMIEPDLSFGEFLRRYCTDLPVRALESATSFVEGFDAADAERISARSVAEEQEASEQNEEDRTFRLLDGYDRLAEWLAAGLDKRRSAIRLKAVVTEVRWQKGSVEIDAISDRPPRRFRAERAVITLPLGVLKAGEHEKATVRFDPELPEKRDAASRLEMGAVVKTLIQFREPFWEHDHFPTLSPDQSLRDAAFLHAHGPPVFTWWTMLPVRSNLLVGWSGGPSAMRLSHRAPGEVVQEALRSLSAFLGVATKTLAAQVERAVVADWQADEFSRGAYSYTAVGGHDARAALAKPVDNTLFFAGEATHEGQSGTVAGAISSGYRAAEEILGVK